MAKAVRLAKVAREINVGIDTIAAHLRKKGFAIDVKPTTKLTAEMHDLLLKDFRDQIALKERADKIQISFRNKGKEENETTTDKLPTVKKTLQEKEGEVELLVTSHTSQPITPAPIPTVPEIFVEKETKVLKDTVVPPIVETPKPPKMEAEKPAPKAKLEGDHSPKQKDTKPDQPTVTKTAEKSPEKEQPVAPTTVPSNKEKQAVENVETKPTEVAAPKKVLAKKVEPTVQPKAETKTVVEQPTVKKESVVKSEDTTKVKVPVIVKEDTVKEKVAAVVKTEQPKVTKPPVKTTEKELPTAEKITTSVESKETKEKVATSTAGTPSVEKTTPVEKDAPIKKSPKTISASAESEVKTTTPTADVISSTEPDKKASDNSSMNSEVDNNNTLESPKVVGKINLSGLDMNTRPDKRRVKKIITSQRNKEQQKDKKEGQKPRVEHTRSEKPAAKKEYPQKDNRSKDSTRRTPKKEIILKSRQQQEIKSKASTPPPPPPPVKEDVGTDVEAEQQQKMETVVPQLQGPKIVGKIELPVRGRTKKRVDKESAADRDRNKRKRRRKRIVKPKTEGGASGENTGSGDKGGSKTGVVKSRTTEGRNSPQNRSRKRVITRRDQQQRGGKRSRARKAKDTPTEVSEKEIQEKIRATMAKLSGGSKGKSSRAKLRRQKREQAADKRRLQEEVEENNILQVTEFISVSELAKLMDTAVNNVITTCFNLGIMVSINQRLDAEVIELLTEEFGYEVEFISATEDGEEEEEIVDAPEDLVTRSPIVTIMGHVDHGKTSLLDYIRNANVVSGEMGGITQHIGAYEVTSTSGKTVTFLDTPGHEAFTAMRARGAKVTDVAVIVIAADDSVMPQTKEAISHAQAAGVPMVFAINKIDKPDSFPERIKEQLAAMNILVEDWGGNYQCQEVSAKSGLNVDALLEKIGLEAELLELKANPDRGAIGTVIEASLDKGRGYMTTVLVQSGTLEIGDIVLGGQYTGRVKAMFNERGKRVKKAGPSQPVLLLGLNGAPQAGDRVKAMESEQEARNIAQRRMQLVREQQQRTSKHITLEEIGRRLALGNFKELNLIVKGDVDGSVEALSDSLLKLSTEEIQVRIIHRAVGPIIGSDVLLASASDAIIIGFQVRPTLDARRQAENESIDVRMYSIIYDAIEEIKSAMEGMLEPTIEERFVCNVEVKDTFKVSKVGTIAGCYVLEGKVYPSTKVRLVRDGIVVYTGEIESLKRYKDDVKEVQPGQECGIAIKNFNDIKVGDIIEGYEEIKIKRTLADLKK